MDEKQFKILTEKLDEIVKYLEKISRYTVEASFDLKEIKRKN